MRTESEDDEEGKEERESRKEHNIKSKREIIAQQTSTTINLWIPFEGMSQEKL